ncbi:hypothetical protein COEREDRAFT_90099 [Coemansia reversa NRRL 1564]|uniref:Uncharacterized protein n=1 Tax=Coemansia reversa (strain ATCC 12441 / NRRL 1564) TaxID=763665 RepID=A0A2G5B123_COERN|nr:hypothetical protein COEREDRAFT_90099 [Coemansia reversa NRRL 1564]|eukprot:PIA12713.1 hypothetical protein COEREDRAFT_90099 [Coemansia reversa NRRL 1564]
MSFNPKLKQYTIPLRVSSLKFWCMAYSTQDYTEEARKLIEDSTGFNTIISANGEEKAEFKLADFNNRDILQIVGIVKCLQTNERFLLASTEEEIKTIYLYYTPSYRILWNNEVLIYKLNIETYPHIDESTLKIILDSNYIDSYKDNNEHVLQLKNDYNPFLVLSDLCDLLEVNNFCTSGKQDFLKKCLDFSAPIICIEMDIYILYFKYGNNDDYSLTKLKEKIIEVIGNVEFELALEKDMKKAVFTWIDHKKIDEPIELFRIMVNLMERLKQFGLDITELKDSRVL